MNKALIQHAEDDIHRHHRGDHQPDGTAERRLEGQRAALELGADVAREVQRLLGAKNRLDRIAQRIVVRHVKRNGGDRELIEMVNRQRSKALLDFGDRGERHDPAVAAGEADIVQRRQPRRGLGIMLQHHAVLVRLGIDGGNQTLTKGVIQGVIDVRHADAEAAGAVAINVDIRRQPLILPVAADVGELRQRLQPGQQLRDPVAQRVQRIRLQGELVLGPADGGVNGQILGRLEIELDAGDAAHRVLQTADHRLHTIVAFIQRLEVNLQAGAVQRRVGAVDADERGQAFHRRIFEYRRRHLLLALGHIGERRRLRRL